MRLMQIIAISLLAAAVAVALLQKTSLSKFRQENDRMREAREEETRLKGENESIPRLRDENREADELGITHQELLKLRNEVRQLREQTLEAEKLRQQNAQLDSQLKSMANGKPAPFSEMQGYVAKETWSNAGFATPEAALQTFLWAVRDGQFQQIAQCMSPESRPSFEKEFGSMTGQERQAALQSGLGQLVQMGGYRIAGKEQAAEDKVLLEIQAVAGGIVAKVVLRRFGDEWKFHDVE